VRTTFQFVSKDRARVTIEPENDADALFLAQVAKEAIQANVITTRWEWDAFGDDLTTYFQRGGQVRCLSAS
jgi:hypothetical protein